MASVRALSAAVIAQLNGSAKRIYLRIFRMNSPACPVPTLISCPIKDAWFSGSMNYIGRARNADGSPKYEATYEINASLQISVSGVRATRQP